MNALELELKSDVGLKRPPLRYHGGKWRLAPWIIGHFPNDFTSMNYVEVFGGAAGVLLRKPRSVREIYNDLDSQVVNFFRVLRDSKLKEALVQLIDLTPFAREEFELAYEHTDDPIESARRFCARAYFGHGTTSMDPSDSNGFRSCDVRAMKSYAREWVGIPAAISATADRFRAVTIEHLDFRKLIPKFDSPETLFYLDPPYPMATRDSQGKGYVHELSDQDHRHLAWMLKSTRAKVLISGYPCGMYEALYSDWRRDEKKTSANGQKGAVSRMEILWMNF